MNIFSEEKAESMALLKFIYAKRKILVAGLVVGLVLGVSAFMVLPEKYESIGIVYPANPYTRDQVISNPQFGHEVEVERLMQLLESRSMRDSVIRHFNLVDYYEIDTTQRAWRERLNLNFISDIQIERTQYMSVVIRAELKDADLAANVVNYIIEAVDNYRKEVYDQNIESELTYLKSKRDEQEKRFKAVRDKIYQIKDTSDIDNIIENFLNKSAKDQYYESNFINSVQMTDLLEDFKTQKHKFMEYDIDYQQAVEVSKRPVLKNYVIDRAIASYKPVSPSMALVAVCAFAGAFITFLLAWLLERWAKLRAELGEDKSK